MDKLMANQWDERGNEKPDGLILSEWEGNFLASYRQSSRPSLWFTPGRRPCVDKMWMKLGGELNFPHPLDTVTERPRIAEADATGCEYLVKGETGLQQRCNEPAAWQGERRGPRPGLRYCQNHKDALQRSFDKTIKAMIFNPFSR